MDLLALFTSRLFGENLCVTESHSVTCFHLTPSLQADRLQAAAEQLKEELVTVSCISRAPSFPSVYISKLAMGEEKQSQ